VGRVVDPRFAETLRRLRDERGLSLRRLADVVHHGKTYVHELETGAKQPTLDVARRLDDALGAGGALAALVGQASGGIDPDAAGRLAHAVQHPRRVDADAVEALAAVLAHQRRLEDAIGSAAMLAPVAAQLATVEQLVTEARGPARPLLVDVAAQWAQFNGWLHTATERYADAQRWFRTSLEWSTEVGDLDMVATVMSFRGHLAWLLGHPGPTIGLSQAARRWPQIYAGQLAYDVLQEARGHAILGDAYEVDRLIDESDELTDRALRELPGAPPWHYYRSPAFWDLERGRALARLAGRQGRAAELLVAGLDALPECQQHADWVQAYRRDLAGCS
jgi:transcriptional regulator with XRE-family HTH domain